MRWKRRKRRKLFDTLQLENNMHSVIGDIRDREKLISTMQEAQPEIVSSSGGTADRAGIV